MRKTYYIILVIFVFSSEVFAQQKDESIDPVAAGAARVTAELRSFNGLVFKQENRNGNALVLDEKHVLTNYHINEMVKKIGKARVEGIKFKAQTVISVNDSKVVEMSGQFGKLKLNPDNDLALLTLAKALPVGFKGVRFANYPSEVGDEVEIRTYRRGQESLRVTNGKVIATTLNLKNYAGQITLFTHLIIDVECHYGDSGSAVASKSSGLLVGIVYGCSQSNDETLALPVSNISRFLRKQNLELWGQVFFGRKVLDNEVEALAKKLEWGGSDQESESITAGQEGQDKSISLDFDDLLTLVMEEGTNPQEMVRLLMDKVIFNLAPMQNVFAEQELQLWGDGKKREHLRHKVALYSGHQVLQEIKSDGSLGKETSGLPFPKHGVIPDGLEWYYMQSNLVFMSKIYEGKSYYHGAGIAQNVYVYSYSGTSLWRERERYLFGSKDWTGLVDCSGRIIVDAQFNILGISQKLNIPEGRLVSIVKFKVLYDFQEFPDKKILLLPVDIKMGGQFQNGRWYYAFGTWKNYRKFSTSEPKVIPVDEP